MLEADTGLLVADGVKYNVCTVVTVVDGPCKITVTGSVPGTPNVFVEVTTGSADGAVGVDEDCSCGVVTGRPLRVNGGLVPEDSVGLGPLERCGSGLGEGVVSDGDEPEVGELV